jgi:hypothetical protein
MRESDGPDAMTGAPDDTLTESDDEPAAPAGSAVALRRECARLRAHNARLQAQVRSLTDALEIARRVRLWRW